MNEKENIIKGGYLIECFSSDERKFPWGVVEYHVIEEVNDHYDIVLRWFGFSLFDEDKEGVGREVLSEYPYLSMLMNIWPGD